MYNGNMQILIYENVNYTKVGSMQSISLAPIGATLELNVEENEKFILIS